MGLNVIIQKLDGSYHPDWDDARYSGDREFAQRIEDHGGTVTQPGYDPWKMGDAPYLRPADTAALERAPLPEVNPDRWKQLVRILRDEPEYWLYFSY